MGLIMKNSSRSFDPSAAQPGRAAGQVVMNVLLALSVCHCCNDALQAVVTSLYPMIKSDLGLNFVQIGVITLIYQLSASVLQPLMGIYLDRHPDPRSLTVAACFTFAGLTCLAFASRLGWVVLSVVLIGAGSSIIHPEASRLTNLASNGKRGLAQSIFQVGGNFGGSLGPLLAALVIAPYGRSHAALVALLALAGVGASVPVARWYRKKLQQAEASGTQPGADRKPRARKGQADWIPRPLSDGKTYFALGILLVLVFSKYIYMSSISSYYTFYLIEKFGMSVQHSQYALFVFFFATAVGTFTGGPLGDRYGRKYVIWISILGTAPFSLAMPHAGLYGTVALSFCVGFMLSSAFPAILIYAQELLPNRLGMVSGLFFGFSFGIAGIASAFWGGYADVHGIESVYNMSAWLPLLGLVTAFLPDIEKKR